MLEGHFRMQPALSHAVTADVTRDTAQPALSHAAIAVATETQRMPIVGIRCGGFWKQCWQAQPDLC